MPRSIHFAPTILPQDNRVSPNWHGVYERGRRIKYDTVNLSLQCLFLCEKKPHMFIQYLCITNDSDIFRTTVGMSKSNFFL